MPAIVFGVHGSFDVASGLVVLPPGESRCEADYWGAGRPVASQGWRMTLECQVQEAPAGCEFILAQLHADMQTPEPFGPAVALWRTKDGTYRVQISHQAGTPFVRADVVEVDVATGIDLSKLRRIVISGRMAGDATGRCRVMVDGKLAGSYSGPLGYADAKQYFARAGLYCWEQGRIKRIVATVRSKWTLQ